MTAIIIDSCNYTRLGLAGYLSSWGWGEKEIYNMDNANDLLLCFKRCQPSIIFLNEDCFVHDQEQCQKIKNIITMNPGMLFIVFVTLGDIHWNDYLRVKKNLLMCSKKITIASIEAIYRLFLREGVKDYNSISMPILSLKRIEVCLLQKWMAGFDVNQIAAHLVVTPKAVYMYKHGIRMKFETRSPQVAYHVYRLTTRIGLSLL